MTVNFHEGRPVEVFCAVGKAGTQARAITEAIGRLISVSLQSGTPLEVLCRQLRGISSNRRIQNGGAEILSIPDAVAQVLEKYIGETD